MSKYNGKPALIAAGWRVYCPRPGRAIPLRHGRQDGRPAAATRTAAWAWIAAEHTRYSGQALARRIGARTQMEL